MKTMRIRSHVGADGMLELKFAAGVSETDVDVEVVVHPVIHVSADPEVEKLEWQEFVKRTAGSWQGEPLVRPEQGEFQRV